MEPDQAENEESKAPSTTSARRSPKEGAAALTFPQASTAGRERKEQQHRLTPSLPWPDKRGRAAADLDDDDQLLRPFI
jgi:hypothetical protein